MTKKYYNLTEFDTKVLTDVTDEMSKSESPLHEKRDEFNGKIMEILLERKEMSSAFLRQLMNIFPSDMKMQINSEDHLLYKNLFELFKKVQQFEESQKSFSEKIKPSNYFQEFQTLVEQVSDEKLQTELKYAFNALELKDTPTKKPFVQKIKSPDKLQNLENLIEQISDKTLQGKFEQLLKNQHTTQIS